MLRDRIQVPPLDGKKFSKSIIKVVEERLWLYGKKVGKIVGTFEIKNPPLLR